MAHNLDNIDWSRNSYGNLYVELSSPAPQTVEKLYFYFLSMYTSHCSSLQIGMAIRDQCVCKSKELAHKSAVAAHEMIKKGVPANSAVIKVLDGVGGGVRSYPLPRIGGVPFLDEDGFPVKMNSCNSTGLYKDCLAEGMRRGYGKDMIQWGKWRNHCANNYSVFECGKQRVDCKKHV